MTANVIGSKQDGADTEEAAKDCPTLAQVCDCCLGLRQQNQQHVNNIACNSKMAATRAMPPTSKISMLPTGSQKNVNSWYEAGRGNYIALIEIKSSCAKMTTRASAAASQTISNDQKNCKKQIQFHEQ